jgi:hypothetical protein
MEFKLDIEDSFVVPLDRFDNLDYIRTRVDNITFEDDKGSLESILRYIYLSDGPKNVVLKRYKISIQYLDPCEQILIKWLKSRTNGRLRKKYGEKSLTAARNAKYKCEECGFSDVRVLQLDHKERNNTETEFSCLCANCHQIKSRKEDWNGK